MPQEAFGFLRFLSYERFCLALLAYEKVRCLLTRGKMEQPPTAFLLKTKFFVKKGLTVGGGFAIITFVDETHLVGEWCNGNTSGSDPAILGSNPSSPAIYASMVKRSRRRPLKAKSGVRFPLEVPDDH